MSFYDTFWNIHGMIEYEKIYGISVQEELEKRKLATEKECWNSRKSYLQCLEEHPGILVIRISMLQQ